MSPPTTSRIRLQPLGWLTQLVIALALSLCIFWILWPADARARWDTKAYWNANTHISHNAPRKNTAIMDGGSVVIYSPNNIFLYAANTFDLLQTLPIKAGAIYLSPDHSMLAAYPQTTSGTGIVRLYRASDGVLLHELDNPTDQSLRSIEWSPDSSTLAIRLIDTAGTIYRYWDATTGLQITPAVPSPMHVLGMASTPDGQKVFFSTDDMLIAVRANDGSEIYRRPLPRSELLLSPDGATLIAYEGTNIRAFRASDGTPLWELAPSASDIRRSVGFRISAVALSPDNRFLIVGEARQTPYFITIPHMSQIALIQLADGAIVRTYWGHQDGVTSLAFTPDSKMFVSTNSDEVARWDVAPLPPWLIWLPSTGLAFLFLYAVWGMIYQWLKI